MLKLSEMKEKLGDNFSELKEKLKNLYGERVPYLNMSHYDFDIAKYFEEINEKMHNFKQEIMEKVTKIKIKFYIIFLVRL
jgi:hypothetical protein